MSETSELEVLGTAWRTNPPDVLPDLLRRVRRQSLWIRLHAVLDVLLSLAFLGGSLQLAIARPEVEFTVLAVGVWIVTLTALAYSFVNRSGTWDLAACDSLSCLRLSLRRCRRALAAIHFGIYMVVVETALVFAWHWWYWASRSQHPSVGAWIIAAAVPTAFLVVLLALRARRRHELAWLESLERDLTN